MIVGQKVVCINDQAHAATLALYDNWIKKGTTYVVREVYLGSAPGRGNEASEVAITLLGIYNPVPQLPGARERGFNSERFAPIQERPALSKKLTTDGGDYEPLPMRVIERRELVPV